MAVDCTREAILNFLKERGGKVKNTDLIERFKAVFPEEPEKKATVRERFKSYVDHVAFVKTESGVKYVCLKKKFRGSVNEQHGSGVGSGTESEPQPARVSNRETLAHRYPAGSERAGGGQVNVSGNGNDGKEGPAQPPAAGGEVRRQTLPGSGCGNDSRATVPRDSHSETTSRDKTDDKSKCREFVCIVEEVGGSSGEMGNRESFRREKRESKKEPDRNIPDVPGIAVIEASPLPAVGPMFELPEPVRTSTTGQVDADTAGPDPGDGQVETESILQQTKVVTRRQNSRGSQHRSRQLRLDEDEIEGQPDAQSLSGSEGGCSPKGSRKHFIVAMMNSSPQVRRSVLRSSVYLCPRGDGDSASLVSSGPDDDRTSVALDPLEHEWMMCASDGEWADLYVLLAAEPGLVLRKDFVTGFTCLHWAAKHGKPELIALIVNFAKQHDVPISVDVRSNTGYTPLHVAAMHNHMDVVKLLVGAYNADVEIRDYSGRKACQYLTDNVSMDIRDIIGAYERSDSERADRRDGGRWRFSKVLQSNLKPLRLLGSSDRDSVDGEVGPREAPLRRHSSLSKMKPKLQRLRLRTSQIVHSASFRDAEELEEPGKGSFKGSFKSRPKTHFFG